MNFIDRWNSPIVAILKIKTQWKEFWNTVWTMHVQSPDGSHHNPRRKKKSAAVTSVRQPPWTGTPGFYLKNSFSLLISIGPGVSSYLLLSSWRSRNVSEASLTVHTLSICLSLLPILPSVSLEYFFLSDTPLTNNKG